MPELVFYTFGLSIWSAVPELAMEELYPGQKLVTTKILNLVEGENFAPSFLAINPKATLPTLTVDGKAYTSTDEVTSYLVENAPRKVNRDHRDLILKIHEDQYDPNFAMLLARNREELKEKAAGFPFTFVDHRQTALAKYSAEADGAKYQAFYDAKKAGNGGVLAIYKGDAPDAVQGFIDQSNFAWSAIMRFLREELPAVLPESGFLGGAEPGEADFHVGAWLARIVQVCGETNAAGLKEKELGAPVSEKVVKYWAAWAERESWKTVYAQGLH